MNHGRGGDRKSEIVAMVVHLVHERVAADEASQIADFVRLYFDRVAIEDLLERDVLDLYGAALAHFRLAGRREAGEPNLRVYNPVQDRHGWQSVHTILEIVNDDMPFLVDSVTMALTRQGLSIHLVIHPVMAVARDVGGRLVRVDDEDCGAPPADGGSCGHESLMHIEFDRQSGHDRLEEIAAEVRDVLGDVRAATSDWRSMRERIDQAIADCTPSDHAVPTEELDETRAFLRWLADDHFTFLGYARYELQDGPDGPQLAVSPGTALGILRGAADFALSQSFRALPRATRERAKAPDTPLLVTKASTKSTVHRQAFLDVVGVKRYEGETVTGAHRFLGLLTSAAYSRTPRSIPILRRKTALVLERSRLRRTGHAGKALQHILDTYPRDELLQASVDELHDIATRILHVHERHRLRLFLRRDAFGRFVTCLVYVPRERYNTALRERFEKLILGELGGTEATFQALVSEELLARLLFTVKTPDGAPDHIDVPALESKLKDAAYSWSDKLRQALIDAEGEEEGNRLFNNYGAAFGLSFQETNEARAAVADILNIDRLAHADDDPLATTLYRRLEDFENLLHFRIVRADRAVLLADALPIFENMGLKVLREQPHEITATYGRTFAIHDFTLEPTVDCEIDSEAVADVLRDTFTAVWEARAENDGFNRLSIASRLSSRQITILRAYCKYLLQVGMPFSQAYIERTLTRNPDLAANLVRLFEARFRPQVSDRPGSMAAIDEAITQGLDAVTSLDEDRIVRAYRECILATLRTNWYREDERHGGVRPYLSIKLDPARVPLMPKPRPHAEIFVYAPWVEGVHLRGGRVARGGLRWSDRREDFRTEVLGLLKAQMVKNGVIVPVGAKGGFYLKKVPPGGDRQATLQAGIDAYKTFLAGLLDITDNRVGGRIVPPPEVVRHDDDDPYLVVAADKGTASFSDIANGVSKDYGFWLGDAFASGGSAGYDHKGMGITARGAWESVKRHFREMGRDCQSEPFTVVGIGDMSGDVFGNGMLLSRATRLVAAFDHRHIFIDPDPDPATSFAERERLFNLARSTWEDYDAHLISPGGGVFSRNLKVIRLSPQARAALATDRTQLAPVELVSVILRAPVDLLWNGGVGTFVKAAVENHGDAQDKTNDAARVDAETLRCKVVGEGGNLGFTQRARIAFARRGGRINTDFIDNSAGVDCSDHEVNIKVLLDRVVADGELTLKQRDAFLKDMTDDVAQLVLRDNILQNLALSTASTIGADLLDGEIRLMRKLERQGRLDRAIELLPSDEELAERRREARGLTRPESSILLSYAKMTLYDEILASDLPDRAYFANDLAKYFPRPIRRRYPREIEAHQLRREIVATWIANSLVNRGLHTLVSDLEDETGATLPQIVLGYVLARDALGLLPLWAGIETMDKPVHPEVQLELLVQLRALVAATTSWFISHVPAPISIREAMATFRPGMTQLVTGLDNVLFASQLESFHHREQSLVELHVDPATARTVAALDHALATCNIVLAHTEMAAREPRTPDLEVIARVFFALERHLSLSFLRERIGGAPVGSRWERLALSAVTDMLDTAERRLTAIAAERIGDAQSSSDVDTAIGDFLGADLPGLGRYRGILAELSDRPQLDLAQLSVAVRALDGIRV